MYNFLLNTATLCKDIFIPIALFILILYITNYVSIRSKYYKNLSLFFKNIIMEYAKEFEKNKDKNNITEFPNK